MVGQAVRALAIHLYGPGVESKAQALDSMICSVGVLFSIDIIMGSKTSSATNNNNLPVASGLSM